MADTFSARAPRRTNLSKPLPRSKSLTEEVVSPTPIIEPDSLTKITTENFKASARRGNKLTKPTPRSKSVTEFKEDQSSGVDQIVLNSIISESDRLITASRATASPNINQRTAEQVLLDAIADLPERTDTCMKHRLKSQVSVDSGVGDCNNNSLIRYSSVGRNNSINEVLPDEGFNDYPDDILSIEEELSSLVIDFKEQAPKLMVLREPISPYTFQIGSIVEDDDAGGILTSSGRRRMFQLYRNSCNEKRVTKKDFIQYTADELLEIGASPFSKKTPESWAYLVHTLPGICLSKVPTYIDTLMYQQERGYVVECHNVRQSHDMSNRTQQFRHSTNDRPVLSENTTTEPTHVQRWTVPANFNVPLERKGFGTPSNKKNFQQNEPVEEVTEGDVILDTKCDVSVRPDRGAIKLFAAARQDLLKNSSVHDSPSIKVPNYRNFDDQSTHLPTPSRQDVLKNYSIVERTMRYLDQKSGDTASNYYHEENFYFNQDLPEKCPW